MKSLNPVIFDTKTFSYLGGTMPTLIILEYLNLRISLILSLLVDVVLVQIMCKNV